MLLVFTALGKMAQVPCGKTTADLEPGEISNSDGVTRKFDTPRLVEIE